MTQLTHSPSHETIAWLVRHRASLPVGGTLIDVGAFHGDFTGAAYAQNLVDKAWLFEPNQDNTAVLRKKIFAHPTTLVEMAVGANNAQVQFHSDEDLATGSVLPYRPKPGKEILVTEVEQTTLDDYWRSFGSSDPIALIKVDTQGYDLEVLQGASGLIRQFRPWLVLELIFVPLYEGQAPFGAIMEWCDRAGYVLAGLFDEHYSSDGWLSFADAVFVPSECRTKFDPSFVPKTTLRQESEINMLRNTCDERLQLITRLHGEAACLQKHLDALQTNNVAPLSGTVQLPSEAPPELLDQEMEAKLITLLTPFLENRTFVDIGAEKGEFAKLLIAQGLHGWMIEPLEKHQECLNALAATSSSKVLPYAITDKDGEQPFFIATDAEGHELDYFHSLEKVTGAEQFKHARFTSVTCRSLDSLHAEGTIPANIGIIKIDTEGNDLYVLKGSSAIRAEIIICEYFTEGIYPGWEDAQPEKIIALMREHGYRYYLATKKIDGFNYCSRNPATFLPRQWGNLFFIADRLLPRATDALDDFVATAERELFAQFSRRTNQLADANAALQKACDERLEVINVLDQEVRRLKDNPSNPDSTGTASCQ